MNEYDDLEEYLYQWEAGMSDEEYNRISDLKRRHDRYVYFCLGLILAFWPVLLFIFWLFA